MTKKICINNNGYLVGILFIIPLEKQIKPIPKIAIKHLKKLGEKSMREYPNTGYT